PVDVELDDSVVVEAHQRRQHVLVVSVNALGRFGEDANWLRPEQIAGDIDVVRGQVDDHAHVPNPGWERTKPSGVQAEHAGQLVAWQQLTQRDDSRVEALDVSDGYQPLVSLRLVDDLPGLLAVGGDRLLDEYMRASADAVDRQFTVQAGGRRDDH